MQRVKLGDVPFSLALLFVPLSHLSSEDSLFGKFFCAVLLLATCILQLLVGAPCSGRVGVLHLCSWFCIGSVVAVGAPRIVLRLSFFTCRSGYRSKALSSTAESPKFEVALILLFLFAPWYMSLSSSLCACSTSCWCFRDLLFLYCSWLVLFHLRRF